MTSTNDLDNGTPPGRRALEEIGNWLFGVLMGALAFVGLLIAARATDPIFEGFGLLLAAFGVLMIFVLIHRNTGQPGG
jgi:hypothetical protein